MSTQSPAPHRLDVPSVQLAAADIRSHVERFTAYATTPAIERNPFLCPRHLAESQEIMDNLRLYIESFPPALFNELFNALRASREQLETVERHLAETSVRGRPGGPPPGCILLNEVNFTELIQEKLTEPQLALIFDVKLSTIARRKKKWGLQTRMNYTPISDEDLALEVYRAKRHLNVTEVGEVNIRGYLSSQNIHVTRQRARTAIHFVDPLGAINRWHATCQRRIYDVPFPNSLWHMDGHHKLIRWKIVIHAAIDGYSHYITFCRASDNNRAKTVLSGFLGAVDEIGAPSRIRVDYGGENLKVGKWMDEYRGQGQGSFIQGKSTHNQRIERLWVDIGRNVVHRFTTMFHSWEQEGILDPEDPEHLWALHRAMMVPLNAALEVNRQMWNHHPMSSVKKNMTPRQQYLIGVINATKAGWHLGNENVAERFVEDLPPDDLADYSYFNFANYGIDHPERRVRPRKEEDPFVEVDRFAERLPHCLTCREFRDEVEARVPLCTSKELLPLDGGRSAYLEIRDMMRLQKLYHDL